MSLQKMLDPSFKTRTNCTPDVLMELIADVYKYYRCNGIHLSGVTLESGKVTYNNIHYHNVVHKFIPKYYRGNQVWNEINLNRMMDNYVLLTIDKCELRQHDDMNHVITILHGLNSEAEGSGKITFTIFKTTEKE